MSSTLIVRGEPPIRKSRWDFEALEVGFSFECDDLSAYDALRSAASRAGSRLKRRFSVRKETVNIGRRKAFTLKVYRVA